MNKETIIIFILSVILSIFIGIKTMTFEEMFCLWALFFVSGGLTYFFMVKYKQKNS